jgi:sigma-B regulation protein RsbU (phosphoserine phosphatase)
MKQLSSQLRQKYAELEEKNALLDMQLEMGIQVQRALLPEINMTFRDCKLLSRYYPAMGIGGDFYKVMPFTEDIFSIVMGDISGHGIAAAFLTAILNMMVSNLAPKHYEPDQLLYYLNNELYALFEKSEYTYYACVFYAVVNTQERNVMYANAGQSLPIHVDVSSGEGIVAINELAATGLPVGMMKDSKYDMRSIKYSPSDLLFFHTDGLQDIYYKNQPDDFTRQIKKLFMEIHYMEDLKEILDAICDNFYHTDASETKKMEMDDVSMIICRL